MDIDRLRLDITLVPSSEYKFMTPLTSVLLHRMILSKTMTANFSSCSSVRSMGDSH